MQETEILRFVFPIPSFAQAGLSLCECAPILSPLLSWPIFVVQVIPAVLYLAALTHFAHSEHYAQSEPVPDCASAKAQIPASQFLPTLLQQQLIADAER